MNDYCSLRTKTQENLRKELNIDTIKEMEILLWSANIVIIFYYTTLINYLNHTNPNMNYYLMRDNFLMTTSTKIGHPYIICTKIKHLNSLNTHDSNKHIIFDSIIKTHDVLKYISSKGVNNHLVYNFSSALFVNKNSPNSNIIIRLCGRNEIGINPITLLENFNNLKNVSGICVNMNNHNDMRDIIMCLKYVRSQNICELYILNADIENINKCEISKLGFNVNLILSSTDYEKYTKVYSKIKAKKIITRDAKFNTYYMCDMSLIKQDDSKKIIEDTVSYVCDNTSLNNINKIKCNDVEEGDFIQLRNISLDLFNKDTTLIWTK